MMELHLLLVPLQMVDLGGELTPPKFFVFKRFIHQYFNTLICTTACLLLHFGNHVHLGYLVLQAKIPQTLKTLSPTESSHFSVSVLLWQKLKTENNLPWMSLQVFLLHPSACFSLVALQKNPSVDQKTTTHKSIQKMKEVSKKANLLHWQWHHHPTSQVPAQPHQ